MKEAIIVFKFPSKSRPQRFAEALKSITDNLARPDLARFFFTLDEDDKTIEEYHKVIDELKIDHTATIGKSNSKIHACNRNLEEINQHFEGWEILVCMSDDMAFIVPGFDNIIRESFHESDLALHFPDQNQGANCMTMSIVDRKYFERTGKIYNEEYVSVECDLEEQEKAQMLGRYRFMEGKRIFNHNHPSFNQQFPYDAQYLKTESFEIHEADKATRRRRKANNYGLVRIGYTWHSETEKIQVEENLSYKQKCIAILENAKREIEAL